MSILIVKDIHKNFNGVEALKDVSFYLEEATINSLIGPNGAGKTTLFNIITGFLKPTRGHIIFDNRNLDKLAPYQIAQLGITRSFQDNRIFRDMTALDNVLVAKKYRFGEKLLFVLLGLKRIKKEEKHNLEEALELLQLVNLIGKKDELAKNLSYGQQKLLSIARTLSMHPKLILLDEPTAGVHPDMIKEIIAVLRKIKAQNRTVFIIEHNEDVVTEISDKVIILDSGRKIAEGMPDDILKDSAVLEEYFGYEPSFEYRQFES